MDGELIKKALCFHGKPMQKIWDDERGVGDLQMAGVPEDGNYSIYMDRQKYFTFQDRAKRLKLHQFLARKASDLYDSDIGKASANPIKLEQDVENKNFAMMAWLPPFETFLTKHAEKVKRCTLESIKTGDIIYGQILRRKRRPFFLCVKPLCTDESNFKLLQDYAMKSFIPSHLSGLPTDDKIGTPRTIETNDYVRCEVVEFSIDAERMTLSLIPSETNKDIKLGKISVAELPTLYSKLVKNPCTDTYEGYLKQAKEIHNPNYDILFDINGLNVNDNFTLMSSLKHGFPQQEYAKELRQQQASKWAFRSVAEGIEYFKIGQHVEAFQCLNKALNIDPRNVEGLVARGALYANKGLFLKAVEDFDKALKLNSFHVNARKYMGETLVALGRSYEEDNRIQDAAKAYQDCLNIIPKHDQAVMLLEAIQYRTGASVEALSSVPTDDKQYEVSDHLNKLNSSPNNGSGSEGSSSASGSESEDDYSAKKNRDPSLSPLSKKMALHAQQMESSGGQPQFHQPFYMLSANATETSAQQPVIPNEFKLDEDDTESRVRKLLQDASKHKKDKKKTKKSKKSKKIKKTKSVSKESSKHVEYSYVINTESTLNANLQKYEKYIQELKKRQQTLLDKQSTSFDNGPRTREKSETPPPPPCVDFALGNTNPETNKVPPLEEMRSSTQSAISHAVSHAGSLAQKFSFQIKKPVKMDKFGMIRLATPALKKSPTPPPRKDRSRSRARSRKRSRSRKYSRSRSKSRPPRRSCSRSAGKRRRWRSRSRSNSRGRRGRGRRSHSSSSSRSGSMSSKQRQYSRLVTRSCIRRSPSPFVPRGTPSPRRPKRRSRSPRSSFGWRGGRGRGDGGPAFKFGNRVWRKPNKDDSPESSKKPSSSDDRWVHDKFENDEQTLEEIDKIISKAREERKLNIISKDKNILKKSSKW